ncbi:MAG: hypothetical protein ACYDAC_01285 [Candidatus Dormibacteria bacterium]
MDEPRLRSTAGDLDVSVDELRAILEITTAGLVEALVGGLVRFEDALLELSSVGNADR